MVAPMYDVWTLFSSTPFTAACTQNIETNRETWKEWQENPSAMPAFPSKPARKDETLDMKTMAIVKFGSVGASEKTQYWTMTPNVNAADQYPTRHYGTGLRVSVERRNSELERRNNEGVDVLKDPTPDLDLVSGRPSFRKVVQALMYTKGKPTDSHSRMPAEPVVMARPRTADPKRASTADKRKSGIFSGLGADKRLSTIVQGSTSADNSTQK